MVNKVMQVIRGGLILRLYGGSWIYIFVVGILTDIRSHFLISIALSLNHRIREN
jgi:hypothetical protein